MSYSTPAEIAAQLAAHDAAVAAAPDDVSAWEARAQLRALATWNVSGVVEDCEQATRLRAARGDFKGADFAVLAREWAARAKATGEFGEVRLARALAAVYFGCALQNDVTNAQLWIEGARSWAVLGENARAQTDLKRARELAGETAELWRAQATVWALLGDEAQAQRAFTRAIRMTNPGQFEDAHAQHLQQARDDKKPIYQRLSWMDWAIESAPDDVELLLIRAHEFERFRAEEETLADYQSALALQPDNSEIYRARAAYFTGDNWWHGPDGFELARLDWAHIVRLQIAAGEFAGDALTLKKRGDTLKRNRPARAELPLVAAYFTVAMEDNPRLVGLYLARAQTFGGAHRVRYWSPHEPPLNAEFFDYLRALALKPSLKSARKIVVERLTQHLQLPTAHEQLEELLKSRELLRDFGLSEAQTNLILAQAGSPDG